MRIGAMRTNNPESGVYDGRMIPEDGDRAVGVGCAALSGFSGARRCRGAMRATGGWDIG